VNPEVETRIVLRPLASPVALGFLGLAGGTFVLAGLNLGWVDATEGANVAVILLGFTVPLQFLASVIAFLARDGVVATAMGLLSGIWLAQALVLLRSTPGDTSDALGLFLLVGAVAVAAPASAASAAKLVPAFVLGTAALRFGVTGVYQLGAGEAWEHAAGIVGLVLAGIAIYAAWAALLEDAEKTALLPFGRRGRGREATRQGLQAELPDLEREAGVRAQL